jgi:flagellar L-ring protein precursor FlgH
MKNRIAINFLLVVSLVGVVDCTQAGSIWAKRGENKKNSYVDDVAHVIGDILTIKISEVSKANNNTKRELSKTTKRDANFDGNISFEHIVPGMPKANFGIGTEYSNTMDGEAKLKDDRSFIDSITVVVQDILPNGNLVIMGTRDRNIAGDKQVIEVSGIVRPSDIAFDNTIESKQIANFTIVTSDSGIAAPYNRPNWLGKILDFVWPF